MTRGGGGFSVAREFSLKKTIDGLRLVQQPIVQPKSAQKEAFSVRNKVIDGTYEVPFKGEVFDLTLEIQPQQAKVVTLNVFQSQGETTAIRYDVSTQELSLDRTRSGQVDFHPRFSSVERVKVPLKEGKLKIRLLADKSILELFAQDGEQALTEWVFPTKHEGGITLTSEGGKAKITTLSVHKVR